MNREDIRKASEEYEDSLTYSSVKEQYDVKKAFEAGVEWFRKRLFHKTKDEVPQPFGDYANDVYPQIPCLVLGHLSTGYGYGVRYWNVEYQVWDDEECDDAECEKDAIEEWCYLDDLTQNEED